MSPIRLMVGLVSVIVLTVCICPAEACPPQALGFSSVCQVQQVIAPQAVVQAYAAPLVQQQVLAQPVIVQRVVQQHHAQALTVPIVQQVKVRQPLIQRQVTRSRVVIR